MDFSTNYVIIGSMIRSTTSAAIPVVIIALAALFTSWTAPVQAQIIVTVSPQPSPFPLFPDTSLYSAESCAAPASTVSRAISAAQIRQVAESLGITFQDPALNSTVLDKGTSTIQRLLTASKWVSAGIAISAAAVSAFKAAQPNVGNSKTWGIVSAGSGSLAAGIPIFQTTLQATEVATASMTTGVAAALISDMTSLYQIPAQGCSKSVMFFGSKSTGKPLKGVIP